jgi:arsenical pump membrane protein
MSHALVAAITVLTLFAILVRPFRWPEAVWACGAAFLLLALRLISPNDAAAAVRQGTDVYLFLAGMMLLAELARQEGVFDWLAALAVDFARGSRMRLFTLVYAVGVLVTVFLSNDATAVVLTPAVYAAVKRARANALPYLYACAFIANAASFVLPISNPANLVVFGRDLPPLAVWLRLFALPSLISIGITYMVLRFVSRRQLTGSFEPDLNVTNLSPSGRFAAVGLATACLVLTCASGLGRDLGIPTLATGLAVTGVVSLRARRFPSAVFRDVSWGVLPLVAGLFVLVRALDRAGALAIADSALVQLGSWDRGPAALAAAFGVAGLSNLMNNLPVGLMAGSAVHSAVVSEALRNAVLIGVDLGPNLSVTGSLATILWLVALRREGVELGAWQFLKVGAILMPPALAASILVLVVAGH